MEGSKTVTLTLTTTELYAQMKEHSYYIGEALKSNPQLIELAAKIQAGNDDDTMLKDFAKQGGAKLGNILSNVVGKTVYVWSSDGASITFTMSAVSNFMDAQKDTLKDSMVNYLSVYMLAEWLDHIKPDEAQRFFAKLKDYEEDMRRLGAQRDKPART